MRDRYQTIYGLVKQELLFNDGYYKDAFELVREESLRLARKSVAQKTGRLFVGSCITRVLTNVLRSISDVEMNC